jgi:hypothetical protein
MNIEKSAEDMEVYFVMKQDFYYQDHLNVTRPIFFENHIYNGILYDDGSLEVENRIIGEHLILDVDVCYLSFEDNGTRITVQNMESSDVHIFHKNELVATGTCLHDNSGLLIGPYEIRPLIPKLLVNDVKIQRFEHVYDIINFCHTHLNLN